MFSDNLSSALLKILNERNMSQESFSEACELSTRYISNVICKHSAPTITSLEKICKALDLQPNDLLLDKEIEIQSKSTPKKVTEIRLLNCGLSTTAFPVCPNCSLTMEREYQNYCDRCGQKLDWTGFSKIKIIKNTRSQQKNNP